MPSVYAEAHGPRYQFKQWQVMCGLDTNGIVRIHDSAEVVYTACGLQQTLQAAWGQAPQTQVPITSQSSHTSDA